MRLYKTHIYKGFVISRTGGPDAPWRAWREDGVKLRAETLKDIKSYVSTWAKGA